MTAAIDSLHRTHPGRYLTAVESPCPELFAHHPLIAPAGNGFERIDMEYPLIHQSNERPVHFLQGYCDHLAEKLGVPIQCIVNRPSLYFSDEERQWTGRIEEMLGRPRPYWLVNAGKKSDYTCKQWPVEHYQQVIDTLQGRVLFVQAGATGDRHRRLRGVVDQVGKTTLRELLRLALHAQGGIGPSTLLQHVFAALEKPYVCLLGGREPLSWVQYPLQTTLHTMGAIDCCRLGACWKSRVVPLDDGEGHDKNLCVQPVFTDPPAPRCMAMISPTEAVRAIERYL